VHAPPGTIVFADKSAVLVSCGAGELLALDEVQLEGKKRAAASELVSGRQLQEGWQLT
jgi:methionyl-tRNA formyltransferase